MTQEQIDKLKAKLKRKIERQEEKIRKEFPNWLSSLKDTCYWWQALWRYQWLSYAYVEVLWWLEDIEKENNS